MSEDDLFQEQPFSDAIIVPNNRQAEEALVGSILINPEIFLEVTQLVDPEDFYIMRNQWIWESMRFLNEHGSPIDVLTLVKALEDSHHLDEIGGMAYLLTLINQVPSALNAEAYAKIVAENAVRRRLINAANDIARLAYRQDRSIDLVVEEAEKAIFSVSEKNVRKDIRPIKEVLGEYYERMDDLATRSEEILGVPTGLIDLDELTGGLQKSDLLILAGRPGSGKTGFMLGAAKFAAMTHKKHVAVFSLEMSNEQLVQRMLAQQTGIDTQRLRTAKLSGNEWTLFVQGIESLSTAQMFLDDTPGITPLQLRTKCRRLHMEYGLDMIIIDYLQLMSGDMRTDNRVQEVSQISRSFKILARELNVPVLAGAQLSRAVEQRADKRPVLSDLRESGSLEQDADIVMFIHRPDALDEDSPKHNLAELIVAKHRNGPTHGGIQMVFISTLAKFENAATRAQYTP